MIKQPNNKALYLLEKSPYGDGEQIVLHVTDEFKTGYICFFDTERGHMVKGNIVEENEDMFYFIDDEKLEWKFKEISIERFKDGLYNLIVGGDEICQLCNTTEDLWEYFRKEFPI